MSSQTQKVNKNAHAAVGKTVGKAKTPAKRVMKKVKAVTEQGVAVAKTKAQTAAETATAKVKTEKKEAVGFIQNVKDHLHSGMEAVGDFMKKITPDALLPDSAKSK